MAAACSIGVAQTTPLRGDVGANVEQHVRLVRLAADLGAQVLVFPELSLTGYEMDLARTLAFSLDDARLRPLCDVASLHAMTLIVGAPVRVGARFHVGALIVVPDGPVGLYTKHHLGAFSSEAGAYGVVPPAEATVFHPGRRNPLVRVGASTAAIAVCADVGRPSRARAAAARGARFYLASMFATPSELARDRARLSGYAARHSMAVALANYGGPTGGLASGGGSAIWSETGALVTELGPAGAGVAVASERAGAWRAAGGTPRDP
jgi:predicted amidohydrolase